MDSSFGVLKFFQKKVFYDYFFYEILKCMVVFSRDYNVVYDCVYYNYVDFNCYLSLNISICYQLELFQKFITYCIQENIRPNLLLPFLASSVGEIETEQTPMSQIIYLKKQLCLHERIWDGMKLFASVDRRKLHRAKITLYTVIILI